MHFLFLYISSDVLFLFTTWNDLFCRCVCDVSICWQMFNFVFLSLECWFQFYSRIFRTHFASVFFSWPGLDGFVQHRLGPRDFRFRVSHQSHTLAKGRVEQAEVIPPDIQKTMTDDAGHSAQVFPKSWKVFGRCQGHSHGRSVLSFRSLRLVPTCVSGPPSLNTCPKQN